MLGLHTLGFLLLFFRYSFEELDHRPGTQAVPDVAIPVLKARYGDREASLQGLHKARGDQRNVLVRAHWCP